MTPMDDLIARLEGGADADRELDSDILDALNDPKAARTWPFTEGSYAASITPPLTTSLDAAVAFVERMLPGWCPGVDKMPWFALTRGDPEWSASIIGNEREVTFGHGEPPEIDYDTFNGRAKSPARALLAAALRALAQKDQDNG